MWGRNSTPDTVTRQLTGLLFVSAPAIVIFLWATIHKYDALPIKTLSEGSLAAILPRPSLIAFVILSGWVGIQAILFYCLPGKQVKGQETPAGNVLEYNVNGLQAWILSNGLFILLAVLKLFPLSIIAHNWEGLLAIANIFGFILAIAVFIKGHFRPSYPNDCKFSGSFIYDLFMGIEINPRVHSFDLKLFFNGRPGIVGWTLINLSFAALQHEKYGIVSDSMILVNFFHALYVVDFFVNEDWYLRTIDIAHEHFGFNLAWGDLVWLPFLYTLQSQYLAYHPVSLGIYFYPILLLGLFGYFIFREANFQKDVCRRTRGDCWIWGKPAVIIDTSFYSADGKEHRSLLLASGLWGISRHCNYLGDILLSLAMCITCGIEHSVPYFYVVYMSILLLHRIERDNARCLEKYGEYWTKYCNLVPYKLIPGVY